MKTTEQIIDECITQELIDIGEMGFMNLEELSKQKWFSEEEIRDAIMRRILDSERLTPMGAKRDDKLRQLLRLRNKEEPITLVHIYLESLLNELFGDE